MRTKVLTLFFLALAVSLFADVDFVQGVVPASTASRAQAGVGLRFTNTTGTTVRITQLGRYVISGNSLTHQIGIYTGTTFSSPAASVTVNCAGATPGQFVYGTLSSPYDLAPGGSICVISSEGSGAGDYYLSQTSNGSGGFIASVLTITDIGFVQAAFSNAGTGTITNGGNNGGSATAFGPVAFRYSGPVPSWTRDGNVLYTDGTYYQVTNAMTAAVSGDIVDIQSATWGLGSTSITVKDGVWLRGQGSGTTVITQSTGAQSGTYGAGLIKLGTNSIASGFQFLGALTNHSTAFSPTDVNAVNWRISDVKLTPTTGQIFMWYNNFATSQTGSTQCRGLIDNCDITAYNSTTELIYSRGLLDAWDFASGAGDANAIYIEDCTFRGPGYVCDANANAKIVIRNCTITGNMKIDGHGVYSCTPYQSCRRIEAYWNTFTSNGTGWSAFELRGGSNFIWNNTAVTTSAAFSLREYGILGNVSTQFNYTYQTPNNYPIAYQIGTGARTLHSVTAIVPLQMVRISSLGDTNWAAMGWSTVTGSSVPTVGNQFLASGAGSGTGMVTTTPASEPAYIFGNTVNGNPWARNVGAAAAGAIALYRTQTGNPSATFDEATIIAPNRNVFSSAGFGSLTGVTSGPLASRPASASTVGIGYWATDQGTWNTQNNSVGTPGYQKGQGRLYTWDGAVWVLAYTPLTYPHPLRGASAPTATGFSISSAGNTMLIGWSENVSVGAGGNGGVTLTASGGAVTATYGAGTGSTSFTMNLSRTINEGEIVTTSYTQPGNGFEATTGGLDVASYSNQPVTNGSTVGATPYKSVQSVGLRGGGF